MALTRPSTLSPEEMEKLLQSLHHQGARITMLDPRVTNAQTWVLATVGLALVTFLGWNIQSIHNLNQTLAVMMAQNQFRDDQIAEIKAEMVRQERAVRIEQHVEAVDGRVTILEKKNR